MEKKSLRDAYGNALIELGSNYPSVVVLDADLSLSTKTHLFEEVYPDRFFEMGIAEQNMMGCAAGLAIGGYIPFVNTFAVFATGRCYDQIRQSICIPKLNVKICGSSAGLSDYGDGSTHQAIDDIALMRALPNMTVLEPCDANEVVMMVREMVKIQGPVYMRVSREVLPVYTTMDDAYSLGSTKTMCEGNDLVMFAHGSMVMRAIRAAGELVKSGISMRVVNVGTIKPLSIAEIAKHIDSVKGILVAEEHSYIGGLCEAIMGSLSINIPHEFIAVKDQFGTSARNIEDLMEAYDLTEQSIIKSAKRLMNTK
jgi:transketolase